VLINHGLFQYGSKLSPTRGLGFLLEISTSTRGWRWVFNTSYNLSEDVERGCRQGTALCRARSLI
jgi:hypothetical protein